MYWYIIVNFFMMIELLSNPYSPREDNKKESNKCRIYSGEILAWMNGPFFNKFGALWDKKTSWNQSKVRKDRVI